MAAATGNDRQFIVGRTGRAVCMMPISEVGDTNQLGKACACFPLTSTSGLGIGGASPCGTRNAMTATLKFVRDWWWCVFTD